MTSSGTAIPTDEPNRPRLVRLDWLLSQIPRIRFRSGGEVCEYLKGIDKDALRAELRLADSIASGEEDQPRRTDLGDYDRAQPSPRDLAVIEHFIDREMKASENGGYHMVSSHHAYLTRKLGLLLAAQFNRAFAAGVASVREENGFKTGHKMALVAARDAISALVEKP